MLSRVYLYLATACLNFLEHLRNTEIDNFSSEFLAKLKISDHYQKYLNFMSDLKLRDGRYTTQNVSLMMVFAGVITFKIFIGFPDENIFWKNRDVGLAVSHYFVGFFKQ